MKTRVFSLKHIAALTAATCLSLASFAQTSVRVEESTSSAAMDNGNAPIDIQMPKETQGSVILTTVTEEAREPRSTAPGESIDIRMPREMQDRVVLTTASEDAEQPSRTPTDGSIDLTPAEFRPAQATAPSDAAATTAPAEATTDPGASSSIPVPTDDPVSEPETQESLLPPAPTAAEDDESTAVSTGGPTTIDEEVEYLPPADLAEQQMLSRGDTEVPVRPEMLTSAPLTVTVPDVFQTTLTNGIKFYHYENRDLPRVRVSLLIEAGKNADPADKVGLAELTARTIRSGGAAGKSGDEIDNQLEQIGSDLELSVDYDHVSGALFALTEKADEAMALLADVLMKPEFEEKKFEQQRSRALEELRRQNDQPNEISRREFRKIIYGTDHPLARTPTSSTITAITLDDVRRFHDARYRPSTLWIGVSGDISHDDARKLVESAFGLWDRPEAEAVSTPTMVQDSDTTPGVYLTKKATAQSQIRLGHLGMERRSPKAYAVNVLNSIYGMGGFSSRLMNEVRTKRGYVYGVGGGIFSDDPVGLFAAIAASQPGTTAAAIAEMINVTRGVVEGPISEQEVETARRDVIYSFINQFDTPHETIAAHMLYDYRDYEDDYLKTFPERVRSVTVEEVKEVAKEMIHPDRLKIYVIGNQDELDEPLEMFGTVHEWSLEDYSELDL